jgi:hypothetical protein
MPLCVSEAEGSHRHVERTYAESSKVGQRIRTGELNDESREVIHRSTLGYLTNRICSTSLHTRI